MAPSPSRTFSNAVGITLHFRRRRLRRRALTLFCKCKECCSREEKLSSRNADFERRKTPHFVREGLEAHRRATAKVKANALKTLGKPRRDRTILSAIKNKQVLRFKYNGKERIVEPQTYGISIAGREVLRARQVGGESGSGQLRMDETVRSGKDFAATKSGNCLRSSLASAQS